MGDHLHTTLEEKLMFLEKQYDDLDEVVRGLHAQLQAMHRRIAKLERDVTELAEEEEED